MNSTSHGFPDDRRPLAHLFGELDESQSEQCFAALREWREESESTREAISESSHHVPAAILSHWERLRPMLSPLERELIEFHLHDCEDCQKDLAFADSLAGDVGAGVRSPRPRARILPWVGGGLIGAAIAATVLLAVIPSETRAPRTPALDSMHWVAPSFTRGIGTEVTVPPAGQSLLLVIAVGTARSDLLRVEIVDDNGTVLLDQEFATNQIHGGSLLLQWRAEPSRPWQPGRYRCRVHDGDQVREGEFLLEL